MEQIERAGRQSIFSRIIELLLAAAFPGAFLGIYIYLVNKGPDAGLELCKLHGTIYLPETGELGEMLRLPIDILCLTLILWVGGVYHLQKQRRLMHRILTASLQERNPSSSPLGN